MVAGLRILLVISIGMAACPAAEATVCTPVACVQEDLSSTPWGCISVSSEVANANACGETARPIAEAPVTFVETLAQSLANDAWACLPMGPPPPAWLEECLARLLAYVCPDAESAQDGRPTENYPVYETGPEPYVGVHLGVSGFGLDAGVRISPTGECDGPTDLPLPGG